MNAWILTRVASGAAAIFFLLMQAPAWPQTYPSPYLPDKFIGDTAIYSGEASSIKPNVLFVIDDTPTMGQAGSSEPYDPTKTYPTNYPVSGYATKAVYVKSAATGGTINYTLYIADIASVACLDAKNLLTATGYYGGPLKKQDGSCNTPQSGDYYTGNYMNYVAAVAKVWSAGTAYAAGDVVKANATDTYTWTCVVGGLSSVAAPSWPAVPNPVDWNNPPTVTEVTGVKWQLSSAIIATVTRTLNQIIPGLRDAIRAGLMTFKVPGSSVINGGAVWSPVFDIDQTDGGNAHFVDLTNKINNITPEHVSTGGDQQPVNEALWDANIYYQGKNDSNDPAFKKFSSEKSTYPNPIQRHCQESFVILITTGAKQGSATYSDIGDRDNDGNVGYADDAAKLLFETDHLEDPVLDPDAKKQRVATAVIQMVTPQEPRLVRAAAFGAGRSISYATAQTITKEELTAQNILYYHVQNAEELAKVLRELVLSVVLQAHTAFVAPTIPVSQQENLRSYSGNRVYMGFFRPMTKMAWRGNMKKYALDDQNNILSTTPDNPVTPIREDYATYVDNDGDFIDDRDDAQLPSGKVGGDFRPDSKSYWTTLNCVDLVEGSAVSLTQTGDGGVVDCGGAGENLITRTTPRNIYTFMYQALLPAGYTSSNQLTDAVNRFDVANAAITPRLLNYLTQAEADAQAVKDGKPAGYYNNLVAGNPQIARDNLVNFIHGKDVFLQNPSNYVPSVPGRRMWVMGDVLHSKPVLVGYTTFLETEENDCTKNKSMIYVGANDGMLHAFRDCDGAEEWAFAPTQLLGNLRQLFGTLHVNFVDSSIERFLYDADGDGKIGKYDTSGGANDRALLIFGLRRGGGKSNFAAEGAYYVIDVTDPQKPWLVRQISSGAPQTELGETWSEPKIGMVMHQGVPKMALFIGAGYDNCNEDNRFGATQDFQNVCAANSTQDAGVVTSPVSALGAKSPMGRGVYVMELASYALGRATTPAALTILWSYTIANDPNMKYSVPGELFLMDRNSDGYVDRFYTGDTGGTLWRFDLGTTLVGRRVFRSNPGVGGLTDVGRKMFYKPDATTETDGVYLYFATGDREHPLNQAVIDRIYAFWDKDINDYSGGPRTEADLVDVTENKLQDGTQAEVDATLAALQTKDGWFVRLDGMDFMPAIPNPGEKVLASVSIVQGVVWVTTYRPINGINTDPCIPGNLGEASALHFKYKTGEANFDFDPTNNDQYSSRVWNNRSAPSKDVVLARSDRRVRLGRGIPSGIVQRITPGGDLLLSVGVGGGWENLGTGGGLGILPLYWRQR